MNWQRCLAAVCFFGSWSLAHAALEFSAVVSVADGYRFILINAETRAHSGWVSLGATFEGHRLTRFDPQHEILTLEHGAEIRGLPLKDDRPKNPATRQRRMLTDDGTNARQKREIPIWIDNYGNVALGGTAVSFDEIEGLFRKLVAVNADVELVFLQPPLGRRERGDRMRKTKNAVLGRAQEAGLQKYHSRVIDLTPAPPAR